MYAIHALLVDHFDVQMLMANAAFEFPEDRDLMELMEARRIILTLGESLGYVCTVALRIYL